VPGCVNALEFHGRGSVRSPLVAERYLLCEPEFPLRSTRR
jgi:hypothetical protein